jgi:hypothetical protein
VIDIPRIPSGTEEGDLLILTIPTLPPPTAEEIAQWADGIVYHRTAEGVTLRYTPDGWERVSGYVTQRYNGTANNKGVPTMGMLVITCPNTGKEISTGFGMDKRTFEDPTNVFRNNQVGCPACGQTHTWSKEDARLKEDS